MKNYDDKQVPKHRSKNDTKKWCRGKVGVKNVLLHRASKRWDWHELSCGNCDKIFKTYFHMFGWPEHPEQDLQELIQKLYGDE